MIAQIGVLRSLHCVPNRKPGQATTNSAMVEVLHLGSLTMRRIVLSQFALEEVPTEASNSLKAALASSCIHGHRT